LRPKGSNLGTGCGLALEFERIWIVFAIASGNGGCDGGAWSCTLGIANSRAFAEQSAAFATFSRSLLRPKCSNVLARGHLALVLKGVGIVLARSSITGLGVAGSTNLGKLFTSYRLACLVFRKAVVRLQPIDAGTTRILTCQRVLDLFRARIASALRIIIVITAAARATAA